MENMLSIVTLAVAILAGIFGLWQWLLNRNEERRKRREAASMPTPPTTADVWARQDRIETEMRAMLGVLYDVADQQPGWKPILKAEHVRILGDKLPMEWRERVA